MLGAPGAIEQQEVVRGANDNGAADEGCVTDPGVALPASIGPGSMAAALPPELLRVVRALARVLEEDQFLASMKRDTRMK
jgi:hypothetical protein